MVLDDCTRWAIIIILPWRKHLDSPLSHCECMTARTDVLSLHTCPTTMWAFIICNWEFELTDACQGDPPWYKVQSTHHTHFMRQQILRHSRKTTRLVLVMINVITVLTGVRTAMICLTCMWTVMMSSKKATEVARFTMYTTQLYTANRQKVNQVQVSVTNCNICHIGFGYWN